MTNYRFDELDRTTSTLNINMLASTILLGAAFFSPCKVAMAESTLPISSPKYTYDGIQGTYNVLSSPDSENFEPIGLNFENTFSEFYEQLLGQQSSLGTEFEKVLYDNLWDLYVE